MELHQIHFSAKHVPSGGYLYDALKPVSDMKLALWSFEETLVGIKVQYNKMFVFSLVKGSAGSERQRRTASIKLVVGNDFPLKVALQSQTSGGRYRTLFSFIYGPKKQARLRFI